MIWSEASGQTVNTKIKLIDMFQMMEINSQLRKEKNFKHLRINKRLHRTPISLCEYMSEVTQFRQIRKSRSRKYQSRHSFQGFLRAFTVEGHHRFSEIGKERKFIVILNNDERTRSFDSDTHFIHIATTKRE